MSTPLHNDHKHFKSDYYYSRDLKKWNKNTKYTKNKYFVYGFGIPAENTNSSDSYYDKGFISCYQTVIRNGIMFELEVESIVINSTDIQDNIIENNKRYVLMRYLIRKHGTDKWYNMNLVKPVVNDDIAYIRDGSNGDIYYYACNYPDTNNYDFVVTDTGRLYGLNWFNKEEVQKGQREYFNNEYFESEDYDLFLNNYNSLSKIIEEKDYKSTNGVDYTYRVKLEQDEHFLDKKRYTIEYALKGTEQFNMYTTNKFAYKTATPIMDDKSIDLKGKFSFKEEDLDKYTYSKGKRIINNKVLFNSFFPISNTTQLPMSDTLKGTTIDIGKREVNSKIGYNGSMPIRYTRKKNMNGIDYKDIVDRSIENIKLIIEDRLDSEKIIPFKYKQSTTLDNLDSGIDKIKAIIDKKIDNHGLVPFYYKDTSDKSFRKYNREEMNKYMRLVLGETLSHYHSTTTMSQLLRNDKYSIEKDYKEIYSIIDRDIQKDLLGTVHVYGSIKRLMNEDVSSYTKSITDSVKRVIDKAVKYNYVEMKEKANLNYNGVVKESLNYIKSLIDTEVFKVVPFKIKMQCGLNDINKDNLNEVKRIIDDRIENHVKCINGKFIVTRDKKKSVNTLTTMPSNTHSTVNLRDLIVGQKDVIQEIRDIIDRNLDNKFRVPGKYYVYATTKDLFSYDKPFEKITKTIESMIDEKIKQGKFKKRDNNLDYVSLVRDTIKYAKSIIDSGKASIVPFKYSSTIMMKKLLERTADLSLYINCVKIMIDERLDRHSSLPVNIKTNSNIFKMKINYNRLVENSIANAKSMINIGSSKIGEIHKRFNITTNDLLNHTVNLNSITQYIEKMIDKQVDSGKPLPFSYSTKDNYKIDYKNLQDRMSGDIEELIIASNSKQKSFKYHFFSNMEGIDNLSDSTDRVRGFIDKRISSGKALPYDSYKFTINEINYNNLKTFTITKAKEIIDAKLEGKLGTSYTKHTYMSIFEMLQNEYIKEMAIQEMKDVINNELMTQNSTVPFTGHLSTNMATLFSNQRSTYLDNVYKRIVKIIRRRQDVSQPAPLTYHIAYNQKPREKVKKPAAVKVLIKSHVIQDLNRVIDSKLAFGFVLPYTYKTSTNSMKNLLSIGKEKFVNDTLTSMARMLNKRMSLKQEVPATIHDTFTMDNLFLYQREMTKTHTMNNIKRMINHQYGFSIDAPYTYHEYTTIYNFFRVNKDDYNANLADRAIMKINSKYKLTNFTPFTYHSARFGIDYLFEHGKNKLKTYAINTAKTLIHKKLDNDQIDYIVKTVMAEDISKLYKYLDQQIETVYIPEIYSFKNHALNGLEYSIRVNCVEVPSVGYNYPSVMFEVHYGEGDNINQLFKRETVFITPENYNTHYQLLNDTRDRLAKECVDYLNTLIGPVDFADYAINETQYATKSNKVFYLRYSFRKTYQDKYKAVIDVITEWSNKNYMFDNIHSTRQVVVTSHNYTYYQNDLLAVAEEERINCIETNLKPWNIDLPPARQEERYVNTGNKVYYLGVNYLQGYATDEVNNIIVRCSYRKDGDDLVVVYSNNVFAVSGSNVNDLDVLLNTYTNQVVNDMKEALDIPNILAPEPVTIPSFKVNGLTYNLSVRYSKQNEINEIFSQGYIDNQPFGSNVKRIFMKDQAEADKELAIVANDLLEQMKSSCKYSPEDITQRYNLKDSIFLIETKFDKSAGSNNVTITTYIDNKVYKVETGNITAANLLKDFNTCISIATTTQNTMSTVLKDVPVSSYTTLDIDDIHYNLYYKFMKEPGISDITYTLNCDNVEYYKGYLILNGSSILDDISNANSIVNNKKNELLSLLRTTTLKNTSKDITVNGFNYNVKTLYQKYANDPTVKVDVLVDGSKYATYAKDVRCDTIVSDFNNIENVVETYKTSINNIISKSPENISTVYRSNTFTYRINVSYFKNANSNLIDTKIYVDNVPYTSRFNNFDINKFNEFLSEVEEWKTNQLDGLIKILDDSPTNIEEDYKLLDFTYNIKANYTKVAGSRTINTVILLDDIVKETFTTVIDSGNLNEDLIKFRREIRDHMSNLKANLKGLRNENEVYEVDNCKFHLYVEFIKNTNNITCTPYIDGRAYKDTLTLDADVAEFGRYEGIGKQYIADMKSLLDGLPKNIREIYNINGFSFNLAIKLFKEPDDSWITMEPYEDGFLVTDLARQFNFNPLTDVRWMNDESMDMMIRLRNLFFRLPINYTSIHEVGDMSFLVGATFNKEAGSELVSIQIMLDNEPYGEPYIMNLTLDNMNDEIYDKATELVDTLKAKLDTLPVTNIQNYNIKKFNFNVKTYFKKELRNDMVKVWMKVDDREFDSVHIETFNINDFSNIVKAYQDLIDKLDLKLKNIIPKDIHTTHTKNMTMYAIDVYFSKPINSNSMKIEYNVNNVTLSTTNALMKYN